MTPADFKTLRESLGLSAQWLADTIGVDQRTIRRWEDGVIPLRPDAVELLTRLDNQMVVYIDGELERILDDTGIDPLDDDLTTLAPEAWPTIEVPRVDTDIDLNYQISVLPADLLPTGKLLPASWYRAAAGRMRYGMGGTLHITYIGQ